MQNNYIGIAKINQHQLLGERKIIQSPPLEDNWIIRDHVEIEKLKKIIEESNNIVFFGGAGVSTASGIPDFRSANGLYNENTGMNYSPEEILSHTFFLRHTREFFDFYRTKMIYKDAKPNDAHITLQNWSWKES